VCAKGEQQLNHLGTLVRNHQLVWAFNFVLGLQEFFTAWLARALGALIDRVANGVTVIAGSFGARARKLLTGLAGLEELAFERSVLAPQFAFTHDAHNLPLKYNSIAFFHVLRMRVVTAFIAGIHPKTEKAAFRSLSFRRASEARQEESAVLGAKVTRKGQANEVATIVRLVVVD
jgi:hypothetical protein